MTTGRTLPHDAECEQSILGGILLRPSVLSALPKLETDDFYVPRHRAVWEAMRNLEAAHLPIDQDTIADAMGEKFEPCGGYGLLGEIVLHVPTPDNVAHYAAIVHRHRVSRDVAIRSGEVIAKIYAGDLTGAEAVSAMQEVVRSLSTVDEERGRSLGQLIRDEYNAIASEEGARARGEQVMTGMPSGLSALDAHTGGIPFGLLTLVIARPGQGKTTMAMRLAWAAARAGNDTPLVYSYEDGGRSFAQRALAQTTGVATQAIRARDFTREDLAKIHAKTTVALARREVIVRAAGMSVEQLVRDVKSRRLQRKGDHTVGRLVVVDYVQRMPLPRIQGMTKNDRIGEISKQLTDLAAIEDVAVVLCCQLNREVEKREGGVPMLSDIRDCGELEQDGKLVLGLQRTEQSSSKLNVHILKNHNGEAGKAIEAFWHLQTHTICDSPTDLPWLRGN